VSDVDTSSFVEQASAYGFDETVQRLINAVEGAGMSVLARIDHAAGARKVGMAMPNTVVMLYGHPRGGTPIMQAAPHSALDLPLRALIRDTEGGKVMVAYHPIADLLRRDGVPEDMARRLEPAQKLLLEAIR
jgi:uncharacterized protein (DUF302 family)